MSLSQSNKLILLQLIAQQVGVRRPSKKVLLKRCVKKLEGYKRVQVVAIDNYYANDMAFNFELMRNKLLLCYFPNVQVAAPERGILTEEDIDAFVTLITGDEETWVLPEEEKRNEAVTEFIATRPSWQSYQATIEQQQQELMTLLDTLYDSYRRFLEDTIDTIQFPFDIDSYL